MFVPARPPAPPTGLLRRGEAQLFAALPELHAGTELSGTNPYDRTELSEGCASSRPGTLDPAVADHERYVFGEVFASGGLGVVRRGEDRRLGRAIAIKELLRDSPAAQRRFALEAAITARLQHPGIVPLYDLGWQGSGKPYYCMKLVEGESLEARIQRAQDLGQRLRLIEHVIDVADAIAYAHERQIIHRDLKPANVLVGRFGETVVIDWGLAKDLSGEIAAEVLEHVGVAVTEAGASDMTEAGTVMGTLRYMPPEQAAGEAVDARSDVYALGAMLHHVLAGRPPFADLTGNALVVHVIEGRRADLQAIDPAIPRELAAIAERAMAREPAARYASAAAFAEDLRRFQAGRMVSAHAYSLGEVARLWLRRHRAVVAVASVLLAALVATGIVAAGRIDRERLLTAQAEEAAAAEAERAERAAFERATLVDAERAGEVLRLARTPGRELDALALGVKVLARHQANHLAAPRVAIDGVARALSAMLPVATLSTAERPVYSVRFSPDGAWLATTPRHTTAPGGRELAIWSTERLAIERTLPDRLPGDENSTGAMTFSPDSRRLAVSSTRRCIVWDVAGTTSEVEITGCADPLFSTDGTTLFGKVPAAEDEFGHTPNVALAAWDARNGSARWSTPIPGKQFLVLVHPDGERLIVKTHDPSGEALVILAADSGRRLATLAAGDPKSGARDEYAWMSPGNLALAADGRQVADGRLNVWDLDARTRRSLGDGSDRAARAVSFSADGRRLLAHGGGLDVFELASSSRTLSLPGAWFVAPLAFAELGTDGKELWNLSAGMWHQELSVGEIRQLESSADGRFVALVTASEALLWSSQDFAALAQWRAPREESVVAYDEREVVTRDASGALRIHDRSGGPPVLLDGRGGDNPSRLGAAWSVGDGVWRQIDNDLDSDGMSVAANNLRFYDRRSGREVFAQDGLDDQGLFAKRAQPSRRASLLATARADGGLVVVDAARSRRVCTIPGGDSRIEAVAMSERGEWVAAIRQSGELAIWDVPSCAPSAALRPFLRPDGEGGIDELTTFEFAASGALTLRSGARTVVVDPRDGAVRLAVEDSCRQIGPGYSLLSPDGRYLLTACGLPDSSHVLGSAHGQAWLRVVDAPATVTELDLSGHSAHKAEFSRSGELLALLTEQGALSLFATSEGAETLQIRGRARLLKFRLRDDGAFADALATDGAVYTFPLTREGIVAAACRALAHSTLAGDVADECGGAG